MNLVGPPQIPELTAEESQQDMVLDMIDLVSEGEEKSTFEEDLEASDNDEIEALDSDRIYRVRTGQQGYGDLSDAEQDQLMSQIVDDSLETNLKKANSKLNTLLLALDQLGVRYRPKEKGPERDTKRIPSVYMKNSRSVRLAVLAGLIDSDGYYEVRGGSGRFGFEQSEKWHSGLFEDVVALARSLGFSVGIGKKETTRASGVRVTMLRAWIAGDLKDVPCLLARKKALERLSNPAYNYAIRDIVLESKATKWAGFRVDQDQLYLRHDYMVLHNSGFEEVCYFSFLPLTN